jgi:hypothetical protein
MVLSKQAVFRVGEIFKRANLGDPRLVRRAVGLAEAIAQGPERSLPRIWSTPAELEAGYRFLRSARSEFAKLMEPVQQTARELALQEKRVLILHDTTEVTCPAAEPEEVGFLATGKAGFYVHHALCVSADGTRRPLGVVWSQLWGRPARAVRKSRKMSGPELAKQQERESDRWLEGVTEAQLWTEGCEEAIHVMDREADSYRVLDHLSLQGADFVVRLRHDRRLEDGTLAEVLAQRPLLLQRDVPVSEREAKTMPNYTHQGRSARGAKLTVRCAKVEFEPPQYLRHAEPVALNVVQILEENPPTGATPISWVLATSLPVSTREQAERVIDAYRARWVIEEFHKALKTGCMFEKRQLESFESITSLLAICYPIACELLLLRGWARQKRPATEVLRPSLIACLRAHPKARPMPQQEPTTEDVLAVIAGLGGHIRGNGPPGWQTIAAGYIEILAFARGWLAALAHRNL